MSSRNVSVMSDTAQKLIALRRLTAETCNATAGEVRRELANDRLPPVQPFHAMAYPFSAELALKISAKYAEFCAVTAARMGVPKLLHPPVKPLQV